MTQARYDLSFAVTLLASSLSLVASENRFLPHFIRLCAVSTKKLLHKDLVIWFHPMETSSVRGIQDQLIAFPDAGYANLPLGGSAESCFLGFGRPLRRDGIAECMAHPIFWSTRKIKRVARSSSAAEVTALRSTIDACYWLHAILTETLFGTPNLMVFGPIRPSPLFSPFSPASAFGETIRQGSKSISLSPQVEAVAHKNQVLFVSTGKVLIPFGSLRQGVDIFLPNQEHHPRIAMLILTDSDNAFSASHSCNPRSVDKHTRVAMCFIRGGMDRYNLSFLAAGLNVADVGTKWHVSDPSIMELFSTNRCYIGFLSRVETKQLSDKLRDSENDAFTKIRC